MTRAAVFMLAAVAIPIATHAQPYPTKPVRMIVPYVAGGNADIQARYIAERLSDALGKQFVVDNRGGANGVIGLELAARSVPDGYTLVFVANTYTVTPSLFAKVPYDTIRDFQPITLVGETPELFIGNSAVPANSVKEILALAKSRPGQLNYGSTGNGSPSHLSGALFELLAGVKLTHVPFKGMPASNLGVMTGQIQLGFPSFTSVFPLVKAGKLKAFAITTKKRSPLAPDIPTMDEAGVPGYEASIWNGMLAPTGTPKAIVNRLNETIVQILKSPQAAERYANVGAEIRYNSPEEFAAVIRTEMAKWAKVIKAAGIRVDQL
ncbi:MAG: tripartite tricarboxylate transporter substrate binding protein [Pseudomonadota bacterium]